jgi:hypothetical protein
LDVDFRLLLNNEEFRISLGLWGTFRMPPELQSQGFSLLSVATFDVLINTMKGFESSHDFETSSVFKGSNGISPATDET